MIFYRIAKPKYINDSVMKKDFNVLVNPLHKDFPSVKIVKVEACLFDVRFFA